jgi:hypothetical protein
MVNSRDQETVGIGGENGFSAQPGRVRPMWRSKLRRLIRLDGEWTFAVDAEDIGERDEYYVDPSRFVDRVQVTGNWNAQGVGGIATSSFKAQATGPMKPALHVKLRGSYFGTAWYCRHVKVPADWRGSRVFLTFGGIMPNLRLWLNGRIVAARSANGTPIRFDVTDWIACDEENRLVVKIDNREENMALFSHLNHYSRWGGLYHSVELEAISSIWIQSLRVIPDIDAETARVSIRVLNATSATFTGELRIVVTSLTDGERFTAEARLDLSANQATEVTASVKIQPVRLWSPEQPELYRIDSELWIAEDSVDSYSDRFGMRKLEDREDKVYLNNRPFYIRGQHCNWFCARTLSPPVDRGEWRRYLSKFVAYGYNYLRTPWILPDEFFQIADEIGIAVQPSLDYVNNNPKFASYGDELLARQLSEVVSCFFNHPSLFTYELSNETWEGNPRVTRLYHLAKKWDSTRFAMDSDGVWPDNPPRRTNDLRLVHPHNHGKSWQEYMEETSEVHPEDKLKPVVMHEYLNLPTLPDVGTIPAYSGGMVAPTYLREMQDWLEGEGLLKDFPRYLRSSYALQAMYTKEGIEICRKHPHRGGYSNCAWSDTTPNAMTWGVLNQFLEKKGTTAVESRRYNGASVLLVNLPTSGRSGSRVIPNYTYYMDEDVDVEFLVHDFSVFPIRKGRLDWTLDSDGEVLAAGAFESVDVPPYSLSTCGQTTIPAVRRSHPCRTELTVRFEAEEKVLKNRWPLWFFPKPEPEGLETERIFVDERVRPALQRLFPAKRFADSLNDATLAVVSELHLVRDYLDLGGHVLMLSVGDFLHVQTGFWPGWYVSGNRNLGAVVAHHLVLGDFPHDGYASWQFRFLLDQAVLPLEIDIAIKPVVSGIIRCTRDTKALPRLAAHLFGAKVGAGFLLGTGMRLLEARPEAEYLLDCLIRYLMKH